MKQLRVIFLLLLFLHSKVGVALNVHYCGGHVASISSAFSPENCGMEKPKPVNDHLKFSSKHCCDDDLIVQQNENDQKQPDQDQQLYIGTTAKTQFQILSIIGLKEQASSLTVYRPPPKAKYYQLYCAYTFYG